MKGFKKDGKFRPTEKRYTKNSLKKKDLYKKSLSNPSGSGHEMREKKTMNSVDISKHNWGLIIENGQIEEITLGNWTDAGWHWSLNGEDARDHANSYMVRVAGSGVQEEFLQEAEEEGIDFNIFKKQALDNLSGKLEDNEKSDDGLWSLSGDASNWKFGQDSDGSWTSAEESFFDGTEDVTDEQQEEIMEEAYTLDTGYRYPDWLEQFGDGVREEVIEKLKRSDSFKEYFTELEDERFTQSILEDRVIEGEEGHAMEVIQEALNKLRKEGKIPKRKDD